MKYLYVPIKRYPSLLEQIEAAEKSLQDDEHLFDCGIVKGIRNTTDKTSHRKFLVR